MYYVPHIIYIWNFATVKEIENKLTQTNKQKIIPKNHRKFQEIPRQSQPTAQSQMKAEELRGSDVLCMTIDWPNLELEHFNVCLQARFYFCRMKLTNKLSNSSDDDIDGCIALW